MCNREGEFYPGFDREMGNPMSAKYPTQHTRRVPVVDSRGVQLMPCTPPKARILLDQGKARPKRSKLGLFYIQLTYVVYPDNQPLAVGIDPGSTYEGYSVVGTQDTVLNIMSEAPTHVKKAVETRRTMRRARRFRKWRRPIRSNNRLNGKKRLPASTRSRWEAKARMVHQLTKILPLTDAAIEDVAAVTRRGKGGKWNSNFSPVQVGKEHLYDLLGGMGLQVRLYQGYETKMLREAFGLKKTSDKSKQSFWSHAVDAWALAADVLGTPQANCTRLHYMKTIRLHRRQLHRLQASKGGVRKPYGGTQSLGIKRGALVQHPRYGLCSVGGCDFTKQLVSLHAYRSNKRLTQRAKPHNLTGLTSTPYRTWLV